MSEGPTDDDLIEPPPETSATSGFEGTAAEDARAEDERPDMAFEANGPDMITLGEDHVEPALAEDTLTPRPADETTTAEDATRAAVEALRAVGARLERRLDSLQALFEREVRAEATREKVVDRLHAELQEYKRDLLLSTLRPVFIDLIELHDDIGKVAVASLEGDDEVRRLVDLMAGFQQGIVDILYRQGVEPFEVEGEAFDPRRQRSIKPVPTDDPARNKTIAERIRKGFQAGDRVIRPELVAVYVYRPG